MKCFVINTYTFTTDDSFDILLEIDPMFNGFENLPRTDWSQHLLKFRIMLKDTFAQDLTYIGHALPMILTLYKFYIIASLV